MRIRELRGDYRGHDVGDGERIRNINISPPEDDDHKSWYVWVMMAILISFITFVFVVSIKS